MTAEPMKYYLGEMMVHKPSRKTGPIVRTAKPGKRRGIELTLKTYDGLALKGAPSDFEPATPAEFLSFVEGFLSDVPVTSY